MFTRSVVAIVTPMDEEDSVCRASLKKLVDYHIASDTSAIVPVGTTGEPATLNRDEHADVVMMILELADGCTPATTGTGVNATAEAISLMQRSDDGGVIGCLTVAPYYNRPSQEGLYQHFKVIAERTDLPQIPYNVLPRTGCDLLPEMVGRLARVKSIIRIKGATGNLTRIGQIEELVSGDFALLSGDDASALDLMQLGDHGVISVTANVVTRDMARMYELAAGGHFAETRAISQRLIPLHNRLFVEPSSVPVK